MEVVVSSSTEVIVLQVTLAVEGDVSCLYLPILNVDLVTTEDDGDVLTDTDDVSVPVGDILVSDSRSHVEHDDSALTLNIVAITKTTKLLLSSGIPYIEDEVTTVGAELEGMYFHSQSRDVLLLELTCKVSLDKSSLADSSVTD